jgi:hypothetical protein
MGFRWPAFVLWCVTSQTDREEATHKGANGGSIVKDQTKVYNQDGMHALTLISLCLHAYVVSSLDVCMGQSHCHADDLASLPH